MMNDMQYLAFLSKLYVCIASTYSKVLEAHRHADRGGDRTANLMLSGVLVSVYKTCYNARNVTHALYITV